MKIDWEPFFHNWILRLTFCVFFFATSYILHPTSSYARESAGTYAGTFLLAPSGVRAMGMGDAGVAVANGSNGAIYNPATIVRSNYADISFSHQSLLVDSAMEFVGYAQPLDYKGLNELGGAAFFSAVRYVNQGDIEANILKPDGSLSSAETINAGRDISVGIGYAEHFLRSGLGSRGLGEGIHSFGIMVHAIHSRLAGAYSGDGAAFNLGYLASLKKLNFGFSLANLGTQLKYQDRGDSLPVSVRAGLAYPGAIGDKLRLLLAFDVVHEERSFRENVGAEVSLGRIFSARGGWRIRPQAGNGGATFGFGLNAGRFFVDYAFAWHGDIEETHRLLFGLRFSHHPLHYH